MDYFEEYHLSRSKVQLSQKEKNSNDVVRMVLNRNCGQFSWDIQGKDSHDYAYLMPFYLI